MSFYSSPWLPWKQGGKIVSDDISIMSNGISIASNAKTAMRDSVRDGTKVSNQGTYLFTLYQGNEVSAQRSVGEVSYRALTYRNNKVLSSELLGQQGIGAARYRDRKVLDPRQRLMYRAARYRTRGTRQRGIGAAKYRGSEVWRQEGIAQRCTGQQDIEAAKYRTARYRAARYQG